MTRQIDLLVDRALKHADGLLDRTAGFDELPQRALGRISKLV